MTHLGTQKEFDFGNVIAGKPQPEHTVLQRNTQRDAKQSEIQEELERNAMLLEQLEKVLVALHQSLEPFLMNVGAVAGAGQAAVTTPHRHSSFANMVQSRNDRIEQVIDHVISLRTDLAI